MFEKIQVKKINDYIYLLDESHEATGYLVLGSERAAVIDTMNGGEDLQAIVRTITDLPVIVINTHGHPDHIGGNIYFEEVYMHPADNALAASFIAGKDFRELCDALGKEYPAFRPTQEGDVFDLGGVQLEVIDIPGHTPGGILLINRADGTLFTGDSINWHTWMQLDCCLTMRRFAENLEALVPKLGEVKQVLHGHAQGADGPELVTYHREAVQEVLAGKNAQDEDYTYFGGMARAKAHPYRVAPMRIIYDPARPLE